MTVIENSLSLFELLWKIHPVMQGSLLEFQRESAAKFKDFKIYRLTNVSKVLSISILLLTIVPVIVFGKFQNEFLRLNMIFASIIFTYFGNEHYLIRLVVSALTL